MRYYSPTGNLEVWDKKPKGYYTEQEWQELHPAPVPVPTKEEQLAALDAQYEADKAEIVSAYQTAAIYGDTARMEKIKADLASLDDKYDEDYDALEREAE
jgi:hypothetical protein